MLLNLFLREIRHSILFQSIFVVYTLARFPLLIGAWRYQSRIVLVQEMRRADDSCFTNLKVRALISLDCNNPPQPAFKFCILLRKLVKRAHQAIISPGSAPGNATMVMLSHGVKIQQGEASAFNTVQTTTKKGLSSFDFFLLRSTQTVNINSVTSLTTVCPLSYSYPVSCKWSIGIGETKRRKVDWE